MKPTQRQIKSELKRLRQIIESGPNIESRVAQAAEHALRWSIEDTTGWDAPASECQKLSQLIGLEVIDQFKITLKS